MADRTLKHDLTGSDETLEALLARLRSFSKRRPMPGGRHLREALGNSVKEKVSPALYVLGIGLAYVEPWLGQAPFVVVALMWLVPDRRVERWLAQRDADRPEAAD